MLIKAKYRHVKWNIFRNFRRFWCVNILDVIHFICFIITFCLRDILRAELRYDPHMGESWRSLCAPSIAITNDARKLVKKTHATYLAIALPEKDFRAEVSLAHPATSSGQSSIYDWWIEFTNHWILCEKNSPIYRDCVKYHCIREMEEGKENIEKLKERQTLGIKDDSRHRYNFLSTLLLECTRISSAGESHEIETHAIHSIARKINHIICRRSECSRVSELLST